MIDVIKIINEYYKKECYIEVLADGYLQKTKIAKIKYQYPKFYL